ncbi:MAG: AAA family ATPase [Solibacterales bacterium]|nr:AAA family ATPase [Bryobacterales bacterium]|tara:strand:- start:7990 stop:8970 length:981 start_codon:yes stop_codon:yes gene_type:complete
MNSTEENLQKITDRVKLIQDAISRVIVGHEDVIEGVLISLISGGHVLLEGVPGLGKTTLLRTLGDVMHMGYSRIQFTPDLMPADIVGSVVLDNDTTGNKKLRFEPGPIFSNLVLADEINRATPRTQSALLEAMQERTVTSGTTTYPLEEPFLVMATQNPLEMEGTYPLPEAQLDRFLMKILVTYPNKSELMEIVARTTSPEKAKIEHVVDRKEILEIKSAASNVLVAPHVQDFAIRLVLATQPENEHGHQSAKRYIRYGSSPRGAQALIQSARVRALMRSRLNISVEDIRVLSLSALRHRIILNFDAHAEGKTPDNVLQEILESLS